MPSNVTLKAIGLDKSPNQLSIPPGGMTDAKNVIIRRNDVIESRRGYKLYGDQFGTSSDVAKQLFVYKDRILRHFDTTLQFDTQVLNADDESVFSSFSGSYSEPDPGIRIKSVEANGNFYFTTSDGIKKISAASASQFTTASGYIQNAGAIKALDLTGQLDVTLGGTTGFLPQDSTVAYRAVWGSTDANNNLNLGAPSQRFVVYNPLLSLLLQDFDRVLAALDNLNQAGSLITDGTYISSLKLAIGATATQLTTNLKALVTKLDTDIDYTTGAVDTVTRQRVTVNTGNIQFDTDMSTYIAVGNKITGSTFTLADFNGKVFTVTSLSTTAIANDTVNFTTAMAFGGTDGAPVADIAGTVNSYIFRNISQTDINTQSTPQTHDDLINLQSYLDSIISDLQAFNTFSPALTSVISGALNTAYITNLATTTSSNVTLYITIPEEITLNNQFLQIYRSTIKTATGTDILSNLTPDDELRLVFEGFPSASDISARLITVTDITPDSLVGANLYTNEISGEGILQANDISPLALDINRFKNYIFYANTRTKQRKNFTLLGVSGLSNSSKFTITDGTTTTTYNFALGVAESTPITVPVKAAVPASGYFTLNGANNLDLWYVWYDTTGADADPAVSGRTGIRVNLAENAPAGTPITTAAEVAVKTRDVLNSYPDAFVSSAVGAVVTITNTVAGIANNATLGAGMGAAGFSIGSITQGAGENAATNTILLSSLTSPAQAIDETARSLVHVINQNSSDIVYAYYVTSVQGIPGVFLLESRQLSQSTIYFLTNNTSTGESFSPNLSPVVTGITNTIANPTVVTATAHGLTNLQQVVISGSNSTPSIDGLYTITYISANTFSIPVNVTVAGNIGGIRAATDSEVSDNETKSNRIYYSKFSQPEAVPITNYMDIGSENQAILRIFPLKDSLFVFKEDGLYRVSSETAPFSRALFDSSCILIAPDSLAVSNNFLYGWTTQGIVYVSEATVSIISRPIDTDILKLSSNNYTNFRTATWGIGYDSDNSYLVAAIKNTTDTLPLVIYRYSNLTNSWTTYDKTNTCGIVNPADDKLYLGAGDTNFIEQERKSFDRSDYADRQFLNELLDNNYLSSGSVFQLSSVTNIEDGDVIVQEQGISIYTFNALLKKLDIDPSPTDGNYFTTLGISGGANIRNSQVALAAKLDADPGVDHTVLPTYTNLIGTKSGSVDNNTGITIANPTVVTSAAHGLQTGRIINISGSNSTPSLNGNHEVTVLTANTFSIPVNVTVKGTVFTNFAWSTVNTDIQDQQACYNATINKLNADIELVFNNYMLITQNTFQEAIVTDVNKTVKRITLNLQLPFVVGEFTVYKAIPTRFQYCPITLQDPLHLKQLREATVMFEDQTFTTASISFATDLMPAFIPVSITGQGNGIFGNTTFGEGFFGGSGNSIPFNTFIPRNAQRCRYMVMRYDHEIAREKWSIFGVTVTGEITQSTRAYR